ncbi:MAG: tripartite tricarboxylate transporter substrate binding protein [Betaproteobacteria bacterium]|jgi:tripartite-type tricarboxylate transporter receptor subunit TctC
MKKLFLLFFAIFQFALVWAQSDFPNKPVTIVVATPAGGATDKTVRLLVRQLQTKWKNGVVVENRVGASGNIASAYVAKANPDGYTLLVSAGPFSINPSLFKTLPFDTKKDFVPISQISSFASVLLVHESFSAKTLNDFVATAKNPNEPLAYASAGSGTAQHLGMELLRSKLKLNLNHIPYKGGAPAMNDLLAGHVKVMLAGMGDASPHLNTGRVFPLVTTGKARSPLLPTIPTLQELGILDFDASGWCGLHAPAGTPADIIQRINQDVVAALADPSVRQGMAAMDVDPRPTSVAEFRAFMDSQFAKWKEAVELSGAKAD